MEEHAYMVRDNPIKEAALSVFQFVVCSAIKWQYLVYFWILAVKTKKYKTNNGVFSSFFFFNNWPLLTLEIAVYYIRQEITSSLIFQNVSLSQLSQLICALSLTNSL